MSRQVSFDENALKKLRWGVELLAKAVKVTLGPKGRNVLLHRNYGSPHVTKDGISVAKEVTSFCPVGQMAMDLVKEAANLTVEGAGDGTTTTTVLTEAIFLRALSKLNEENESVLFDILHFFFPEKYPQVKAGSNAMDIKRGIDLACKEVMIRLKDMAREVTSSSDIFNVATISANNDREIGKLIENAISLVGRDGVIQTEDSKTHDSTIELIEGVQLDRGYFSRDFLDNSEDSVIEYENPKYFMYNGTITAMQDLIRSVEIAISSEVPLIIIAEDLEPTVLRFLLTNKARSGAKIAVIKTPGMGEQKTEILKDLAAITGCNTLSPKVTQNFSSLTVADLGTSTRIKISKNSTTIVSDNKSQELIVARIKSLRKELSECELNSMESKLEKRLAQLEGKLAIIYIGAFTEVELKEKKDRLEDALQATKAAIQEGVIPGSGLALLRISEAMKSFSPSTNVDIMLGVNSVLEAIRVPFITILDNAGISSKSVMKKVLSNDNPNFGFNSLTEEYSDLFDMGIMDPAKVTRLAIQNSGSVASMLITTGCVISKTQN